jgi:predicted anti-sigma-YlaC factor YlaD
MRAYKCQCSLFKDYYENYLKDKVDGETKAWMTKHKEECSFCRQWAKSFEENKEDIVINNNTRKEGVHKEKGLAEKIKVVIPLGVAILAFIAVWMSIRLSS